MSFLEKCKVQVARFAPAIAGVTAVTSAANSYAVDTTMADIFAAANITTLNNNVGTLLIALVGINLLFVGYRFLKKTGIR